MKTNNLYIAMRLGVLLFLLPLAGNAQESTSDSTQEKSEWVQVHKADINPDLYIYLQKGGYVRYENPYLQPQKLSNFMKNVVYFGKVTDITLSKVTDNADKFSRTKLGMLSMVIIAYKTIGSDFISAIIRFLVLVLFYTLFLTHWRKRLIPQSEPISTTEGITLYKMQVPIWWHQLVWFLVFLILSWIII